MEALRGDVSDWIGELKDTEDDIAQYEAEYATIAVTEVKDIPFTPYANRFPPEVPADSTPDNPIDFAADIPAEVPEPRVPPFDEHGSMMGVTGEALNPISEVDEDAQPFTPTRSVPRLELEALLSMTSFCFALIIIIFFFFFFLRPYVLGEIIIFVRQL